MAQVRFTNNAKTLLDTAINSSITTVVVTDGTVLPALTGGDWFYLTLEDNLLNREIVKVTARSVNTLTVVRGQDGTSAASWAAGVKAENRLTNAAISEIAAAVSGITPTSAFLALVDDTTNGALLTTLGINANVQTWLATPSSANLLAALSDKTGTGLNVFGTAPTMSALTLTGVNTATNASDFAWVMSKGTPTGTAPAWSSTLDVLRLQGDAGNNAVMQIYTAASAIGAVQFSSPTARGRGAVAYDHSSDTLSLSVASGTRLSITSSLATFATALTVTGTLTATSASLTTPTIAGATISGAWTGSHSIVGTTTLQQSGGNFQFHIDNGANTKQISSWFSSSDDQWNLQPRASGSLVTGRGLSYNFTSALWLLGGALSISSNDLFGLTYTNTDSGALGPVVKFMHDSASPAAIDCVGALNFYGRDSAGNEELYGYFQVFITSPTNGAETSYAQMGGKQNVMRVGSGVYFTQGSATSDMGLNTYNGAGLYLQDNAPVFVMNDLNSTSGERYWRWTTSGATLALDLCSDAGVGQNNFATYTRSAGVPATVEYKAPSFKLGNNSGSVYVNLQGGNGSANGGGINLFGAGGHKWSFGGFSSIVGGGYDSDPTFYNAVNNGKLYMYDAGKRQILHENSTSVTVEQQWTFGASVPIFMSNSVAGIRQSAQGDFYLDISSGGTAGIFRLRNGSAYATHLTIDSSGNGTFAGAVYATDFIISSDERLKKDFVPFADALGKVRQIRAGEYTRISTGKREVGFMAQDFERAGVSALVEDNGEYKSLRYPRTPALAYAAIQELLLRIEALETRLAS